MEERKSAIFAEANSFVAVHLNETGVVEEFIGKVKEEIKILEEKYKTEFIQGVIRSVNHEMAWHERLCAYQSCSVKVYFAACLKKLYEICEEQFQIK